MLKSLLSNQTIQVDAHERGTGEDTKWNSAKDIHIHKRTQWKVRGQEIQVDIKIPINSDRPFSITIARNTKDRAKVLTAIENQLIREITKALSDKKARTDFINDLLDILKNYAGQFTTLERAQAVIKRLAKHFGLPNKIEEEITDYAKGRLNSVVARFVENQNRYFINFNRDGVILGGTIGRQSVLKDRAKRR